jgi:uncharacterized protein YbjT (DUF2867 family)
MILVTGGTGLVGGEIVRLLSQNGTAARALVRNPKNAKNLPVITWVAGDLAKPETLPAAFEGAKRRFLFQALPKTRWRCSTTPLRPPAKPALRIS